MRTNVKEPVLINKSNSRFQHRAKDEKGKKSSKQGIRVEKPKVVEFVQQDAYIPKNIAAPAEPKQNVRFGFWFLLAMVIIIAASFVFRKSLVASLAWAGGAVFLGILLLVCLIGLSLFIIWVLDYWRKKKKSSAVYSIIFFLSSCAMFGISAKYFFNMESNSPEYKQAIVEGVERNLAPHVEHLTVKFRDGSDWYFEPKRLVGEEETDVQNRGFFILALIAIEDERFLERLEGAVDFRSIGRVLWRRMKGKLSGEPNAEGGSTIGMQLAKNLKNDPKNPDNKHLKDRTMTTKIDEAIIAQRIDNEFTAAQQLALYANLCDGSYRGMGEVAYDLFGVTDLRRLELEQAALLVAIPKAPDVFNPRKNPAKAKERRDLVLEQMQRLNFISDEQFQKAVNTKIEVREKGWNAEPSFLNALNLGGFK